MKYKLRKGLQKVGMTVLTAALCVLPLIMAASFSMTAYAAEANVYFGSEGYEPGYGTEFPIGVYIESEDTIGTYEMMLHYDTRFLEYVGGGTDGGNGTIFISGDLQNTTVRHMLNFRVLAAGNTSLTVEDASAVTGDGAEGMAIAVLPTAPINILPDWESTVTGIRINGVDVAGFTPETMVYDLTLPYAEAFEIEVGGGATASTEIADLADMEKMLYVSVEEGNRQVGIYTVHLTLEQVEEPIPEDSSVEEPSEEAVVAETSDNAEPTEEVQESLEDEVKVHMPIPEEKQGIDKSVIVVILMVCFLVVVLATTGIVAYKRNTRLNNVYLPDRVDDTHVEVEFEAIDALKEDK